MISRRAWIVIRDYRKHSMILGVYTDQNSAYKSVEKSKKNDIKSSKIKYIVKDYPVETLRTLPNGR